MNRFDLLTMALQNLWARKSRTLFNIFGIVVSCSMLLLVFAGTRGASNGLLNLFSKSDFARHFAIRQGIDRSAQTQVPKIQPPDPGDGISNDRAERIGEKLNAAWEKKHLPVTRMTLQRLEEIRALPETVSVLPTQSLPVQLSIADRKTSARVICFSAQSSGLDKRVVAGHAPQAHSARGKIWIDEFRAWQLGYKTDRELEDLIGTRVKLRFEVSATKLSSNMKRFAGIFGIKGVAETEQMAQTFQKLFADLDQTNLAEIEKEAIRAAANRLGLRPGESVNVVESADEPFIFREFEIAGVLQPPASSSSRLFQLTRIDRGSDLLMDWRDFHAIEKATRPKRIYYYAIGSVAEAGDLAKAVSQVEEAGYETRSAMEILEKADQELGKVSLVVAAIAAVILLIAAVGIMNTMVIAVMERTPEFGIMKAVGARDADIRYLMIVEAVLTGILGAIVSLGAAKLIDLVVSQFVRQHYEQRIREEFAFEIFVYAPSDFLIVAAIAIVVCVLASLIPARRAAKLDPVIAMK